MTSLLKATDGLYGMPTLEIGAICVRWSRVGGRDDVASKLCGGQLAIEGGAILSGALVVLACITRPTRLSGAAEPVIGSRQRDGTVGDFRDAREVASAGSCVTEAAERVPTCVKFRINRLCRAFRRMSSRKLVCRLLLEKKKAAASTVEH